MVAETKANPSRYLDDLRAHTALMQEPLPAWAERLEESLSCPRLWIVGGPGCGKSAFVRHLAFLWASGLEDTRTHTLLFPFLIRLAELAEHIERHPHPSIPRESPEWLADFLDARNGERGWGLNRDFFRDKLASAFLLLDGLDEIRDGALRRSIVRLIENAATSWPLSRLVVTSRPTDDRLVGFHVSTAATINSYMSLIVVGSVAYDGVETPHGKIDRMLGGAATYIALAAGYFSPVKIVAVVGDDFAQEDIDLLASRNIDLDGLERVPGGKTFFWAGVYSADMNDRTTLRTDLNVFADFNPKLPESYRSEPYLLLGNIQPGLQKNVRAQMSRVKLSGGDTMNYWINDFRGELLETIREWDFLLINDSEARLLSGEQNLRRAAAKILEMGPHTLVIKRGEYGAVLFRKDCHFLAPGYLLEDVFDPTGAGDCFAGGFIGYLAGRGIDASNGNIDVAELRRAVIYGSVMGSFCCEKFGVDRFRTLTREEIEARYREFQSCTKF